MESLNNSGQQSSEHDDEWVLYLCDPPKKVFSERLHGEIRYNMRTFTNINVKCSHLNNFNLGEILLKGTQMCLGSASCTSNRHPSLTFLTLSLHRRVKS